MNIIGVLSVITFKTISTIRDTVTGKGMFQFYIKEKFDVLRMFRLLFNSRYRRVRKMQLHLVLFALFIYTIFKEDNAPVICIHGPHLRG